MKTMYAAVLEKYGQFKWKQINYPHMGDDEVIIRVECAGICGSDQHIFKGEFHPRTPVPFVPGHEFAGTVIQTGPQVKNFKKGDLVAVDPIIWCGDCPACKHKHYPACPSLKLIGVDMNGGFGQFINVAESNLYKVSPVVPAEHAALVELYGIGYHACNRAGVKPDDSVVIWGAGKVGQAVLQAVKTKTSGTVIIVDILDKRLQLAKETYNDIHIINGTQEDPVAGIKKITNGKGVDIAIEAVGHYVEITGSHNPVRNCIQSIRGGGTVCVLGLGSDAVPLMMKELIWKEAKLVASRVSQGEFAEAIENLEKNRLNPQAMITDTLNPEDIQKGFEMLELHPDDHLKIMLQFT
jgi:2-desacetyl-2-hydroxyethyl bacteriochlorophyllide A dehydrogenase